MVWQKARHIEPGTPDPSDRAQQARAAHLFHQTAKNRNYETSSAAPSDSLGTQLARVSPPPTPKTTAAHTFCVVVERRTTREVPEGRSLSLSSVREKGGERTWRRHRQKAPAANEAAQRRVTSGLLCLCRPAASSHNKRRVGDSSTWCPSAERMAAEMRRRLTETRERRQASSPP